MKKNSTRRRVHINIDEHFFNNIFEPERKKLSKIKGVNFTIPKFTEYMAKANVKFNYPKVSYIPKKFKPLRKTKKMRRNPFALI